MALLGSKWNEVYSEDHGEHEVCTAKLCSRWELIGETTDPLVDKFLYCEKLALLIWKHWLVKQNFFFFSNDFGILISIPLKAVSGSIVIAPITIWKHFCISVTCTIHFHVQDLDTAEGY